MYIERKEKFSLKSFLLIILIILLFIFLVIWLVPKKSSNKKLQSEIDINEIKDIYGDIFANNIKKMKNSAINYLVPRRLPTDIDDNISLKLSRMYDLNIISKLKDKNKNECDAEESYVEITKTFSNYKMIVNLKCGSDEDYIIVYLNNYSYCQNNGICEKRATSNKPSSKEIIVKEEERKTTDESKEEVSEKENNYIDNHTDNYGKVHNETLFEYSKDLSSSSTCGDWSNWQKESINETNNIKVETKEVYEIVDYTYEKKQVGTRSETVINQVSEKQFVGYNTSLVQDGTQDIEVGKKIIKTTKIVKKGSSYETVTTTEEVPIYRTVATYKEEKVPIYDYVSVDKEEVIEVPVYEDVKKEVYGLATYYRYKNCGTGYDIKYSYSNNDSELLNKGYKLTGNTKEG